MKQVLKKIAIGGLVVIAVAQLIRPDRTNPETDPQVAIENDPHVPPAIATQLARSCYDCHSNQVRWPWYSNITPVNFLVARDVQNGRAHLNFSEWLQHKPMKRATYLDHMYDEVADGTMPLQTYLLMHPDARWSNEEVKTFLDWSAQLQDSLIAQME